jgi:hypothetical protein
MTHPPPNTKSVEVQARQPHDDDLAQRMSEIELALELLVGDEATHDWLRPPHYHGPQDWSRDARNKEVAANLQHINDLCRDGEAYRAERQSKPRRTRRPSTATLVKRAERTGKTVTGITATPGGLTVHFDEIKPSAASNPWDVEAAALRQKRAQQ